MKKVVIIVGPTASGKTELSLKLAYKLNSEIISADSMQIYKYMDIGTAKVDKDDRKKIKHFMIDIIEPNVEFSVADYQRLAKMHLEKILNDNKIPIVVGGTGLYINSIVYDLDFSNAKPNTEIRDLLWKDYEEKGKDYILNLLKSVDEESYNSIDHNNIKRIIRAIEVYKVTGTKFSNQNKNFRKENKDYEFFIYGLNDNREKLYERINNRVDKMIDLGLFEEVRTLMDKYDKNIQAFKGIGYKEIIDYYNNKYDKEAAIYKLKQNSRKYAKRQLTWFRRDERIKWFNLINYNYDISQITEIIYKEVVNGK
ncbi:tRNA (adenosine(37)-N6)-dimethylallyltransferase MiaA [Miniphocaeibacter halophilus]|uniref:tRNA (Adenosine(37)-N6)-dimethylallyltransferase MiaA n=2 Tax=Miniphocaeibacter halophilus TaxID=2931922 RepID=A0AC61MT69_9FIRM|nr:tRNA (adenosine(37)-N6)-dimethylallyltransferase MiaA [Miniphocaeibacter halophilus]QQK07609.1 tRNA (adenosine(37)-N6)-dimethylallyltransferase MiaA [Miniphocaeibacter halophilus]